MPPPKTKSNQNLKINFYGSISLSLSSLCCSLCCAFYLSLQHFFFSNPGLWVYCNHLICDFVRSQNTRSSGFWQQNPSCKFLFGILIKPVQNRLNRANPVFWRLTRRFPILSTFFHFSDFEREPDRIRHQSLVELAGLVRFLKPWYLVWFQFEWESNLAVWILEVCESGMKLLIL